MKIRHLLLAFIATIVPPGFGWQADELDDLFHAICQVESSGNPKAHHKGEDSRGIVQIRAIMVKDINRILGEDRYTHDDAWCVKKSREMFDIYRLHYHPDGDAERIARCWNGGPKGHRKQATLPYWRKIQAALKKSPAPA